MALLPFSNAPGSAFTSPLTTKGDLYTYTTADARQAVGANATFLKADSTQTTGLTWTTVTKSDVGLGNVENTALSTWAGSTNLTTLGTIATGTWSATTIAINKGGTGQVTAGAAFDALSPMTTLGDIIYGGTSGANTRLAGNITTTRNFLRQTGSGAASAAPAWDTVTATDVGLGNVTNVAQAAASTTITIAGTANQVISSAGAQSLAANRTWTLSTPQDIATASSPTFAAVITASIQPTSDSTAATGFSNAGGTKIVTIDTTNGRVGINKTPTVGTLDVVGTAIASVGTTPGTAALDGIRINGLTGGNTTIATTGTGGAGSAITMTGGTGGVASAATTKSTGGNGGAITFTAGQGADATVAGTNNTAGNGGLFNYTGGNGGAATGGGTGTNIGGNGSGMTFQAGGGGAANSAGTTNTGGTGGALALKGGNGGVGTTTSGDGGAITLTGGTAAAGAGSTGGALTFNSGDGSGTGSGGPGGAWSASSGTAGGDGTVARVGGAVTFTAGDSKGNQAGALMQFTGSNGGTNSAGNGPNGGGLTFNAGNGGPTTNTGATNTGGTGGTMTFNGATGGNSTGAGTTNVGGTGSLVTINGGTGGTSSGATTNNGGIGGGLTLKAGKGGAAGSGGTAGAGGTIILQTTATTAAQTTRMTVFNDGGIEVGNGTTTPGPGRIALKTGTNTATTDWVKSAGWGANATISAVTGKDSRGTVTITTSALDTPTAKPTATLTFTDGTWTTVPFGMSNMNDTSTGLLGTADCSATATTLRITYSGTPTALTAATYVFNYMVIG